MGVMDHPIESNPMQSGIYGSFMAATMALWHREMVRFIRQRNRVISALATPVVFWLLLGSGLDRSFRLIRVTESAMDGHPVSQVGYLEYFFPGMVVMILLFTAIFSTISVIEDRREGFLQAVLAAPIPRMAIVFSKVLGGASLATAQGALVMLLFWPWVIGGQGFAMIPAAIVVMFVVGVALTALGMCMAWPMDSTAGFHALMNLLLMPMWFLSGAVFPLETAPRWLQIVMYANPLTYGQQVLRWAMCPPENLSTGSVPLAWSMVLLGGFVVVSIVLAGWLVARPRGDGS